MFLTFVAFVKIALYLTKKTLGQFSLVLMDSLDSPYG